MLDVEAIGELDEEPGGDFEGTRSEGRGGFRGEKGGEDGVGGKRYLTAVFRRRSVCWRDEVALEEKERFLAMLCLKCRLPVRPNLLNEDLLDETELALDEARRFDVAGRVGVGGEGGTDGEEGKGAKWRSEEVDKLRGGSEGFGKATREGRGRRRGRCHLRRGILAR